MNIITLSIKKPITMLMVIVSLLVIGIYSYRLVPVDSMPDTNLPIITVQVVYPGASPEEVESSVLEKLEDEFSLLEGIKKIKSTGLENAGVLVLEFNQNIDANFAAIDVKDKVDLLRSTLPDDINNPIVSKIDLNDKPIMMLALSGKGSPREIRKLAEDFVKVELAKVAGVAAIDIIGGEEREIHIDLNKEALEARQIAVNDVLQVIAYSNLDFPLGSIKSRDNEINLKLKAKFSSLKELRDLEIPTSVGGVRLGELGEVTDSHKEVENEARFNNVYAIAMNVRKAGDANVVATAQALKKAIPKLSAKLPEGYSLDLAKDQSVFIQNSVADVNSNIVLGILITAVVLFVFLRSLSMTFIASITMPVSLVASFSFVWASGFSINSMTLMALSISVGILVTNSIVILENISKFLARGESPEAAAQKGTSQIAIAVIASTLTNLAVFIPIAFMQSMVGAFFKEFGMTIVFTTVCSLFISFTLTPMMAAKLMKAPKQKKEESEKGFFKKLTKVYAKSLAWSMSTKGIIATFVLIIGLFGSLFVVGPLLGSSFTPQTDEGMFAVTVELPSSAKLETTDKAVAIAEEIVSKKAGVASWMTTIGGMAGTKDGKSVAKINVQMKPKDERSVSTSDVVQQLRRELVGIPDAAISVVLTTSMAGDPNKSDLDIEVTGSDFDKVAQVSQDLIAHIQTLKMTADVRSSWKAGKPERVYRPDREALSSYGLTVGQVGQALRTYVYGQEISIFRDGQEEYDILVRYREEDRDQASDILSSTILSPVAGYIPLSAVVTESIEEGAAIIERQNKGRLVIVRNYMLPGASSGILQAEVAKWAAENSKDTGVNISFGGDAERMQEAMVDFMVAIIMAILLTYILLTALLESFSQPVIIMSTLPLGVIGVVWALFLTGTDVSIIAMMAVVMLIGIVVNNAILIMDEANYLVRSQGVAPAKAIYESSVAKFQAILMMNLATIFAMTPLALGLGEGAEFRQPMAITAIGGLVVSTVLTVYLVPILYKLTGRFMKVKPVDPVTE